MCMQKEPRQPAQKSADEPQNKKQNGGNYNDKHLSDEKLLRTQGSPHRDHQSRFREPLHQDCRERPLHLQRLGRQKLRRQNPGARVYRTDIPGYEAARFVKIGRALCYIDEDSSILEKATGEYHKEAEWLVDVLRTEN